jgi:hypothetical protein
VGEDVGADVGEEVGSSVGLDVGYCKEDREHRHDQRTFEDTTRKRALLTSVGAAVGSSVG